MFLTLAGWEGVRNLSWIQRNIAIKAYFKRLERIPSDSCGAGVPAAAGQTAGWAFHSGVLYRAPVFVLNPSSHCKWPRCTTERNFPRVATIYFL